MKSTVYIVGAGASTEFGAKGAMPVGRALADRIQSLAEMNLDKPHSASSAIVSALSQTSAGYSSEAQAALHRVAATVTSCDSIDDFVNEWCGQARLQEVAKLCIAQVIVEAEGKTFLGPHARGESTPAQLIATTRGTWLDHLVRNIGRSRIERRRLHDALGSTSFIVFNYDRCIEYYLYAYLSAVQGLAPNEAATAVKRVNIIHVYGAIDAIPELGGSTVFGEISARGLARAASKLQTYCESIKSHTAEELRKTLDSAERLVFLGCAFHPQNMSALFPRGVPRTEILGTSYGMRAGRLTAVTAELTDADDFDANRVDLQSVTAAGFLDTNHDHLFD